jgi:DNA (cytosine-5)-methyltransferase 1
MNLATFLKSESAALRDARAASIFSGAGLSDIGYERAGFGFVAQAELDERRAAIGAANFAASTWITGDIREKHAEVIAACRGARLDLLTATPPCQGLSSSNPTRGRRRTPDEERNRAKNMLLLEAVKLTAELQPRIFVAENVRQVLTFSVDDDASIVDTIASRLPGYTVFHTAVNVADYGIPQARVRAVIVAIHKDEPWLPDLLNARVNPWPRRTHSADGASGKRWVTVGQWLRRQRYQILDASSDGRAVGANPLHRVPVYERDRYFQIESIPANSGRSAYENEYCPTCGYSPVPVGRAFCTSCRRAMRNRPFVAGRGGFRLIRGFHSSYRRMSPDLPAPPIMTSSGRVGSDYKIHPWEHRVLSILECADLQTVPRTYDWSDAIEAQRYGLIREVIGEALPPYFTYLHGTLLRRLIRGDLDALDSCEPASDARRTPSSVKRSTVSRAYVLTGRQPEKRIAR